MEKEIKYVVIGGYVTSRSDGDKHYINAMKLCELYKVNPAECLFAEEKHPHSLVGIGDGLPILRPRYDGNYTLPKQ